jgi:hypothetical protein
MDAEERLKRISLIMSYGGLIGLSAIQADAAVNRLCKPYFDRDFMLANSPHGCRAKLLHIVKEAEASK